MPCFWSFIISSTSNNGVKSYCGDFFVIGVKVFLMSMLQVLSYCKKSTQIELFIEFNKRGFDW